MLPSSILSADTQPDVLNSVSIFLRRISSAISEMRTHSIPIGVGRSPDLSYTVSSISFALSISMVNISSCHLSVRVAFVLALMASSTFMITNVSGPLENLELAAWSTSFTARMRMVREPVRGLRKFGVLKLSSDREETGRTIVSCWSDGDGFEQNEGRPYHPEYRQTRCRHEDLHIA